MAATFPVPLAPSNLARHPVFWSAAEVKAWVEFCVQEFSLTPVAFDRFDMNGKAMLLLNRKDFMERAPRVGDVLYNAFTHLSMASVPVSGGNYKYGSKPLKTPVFISRDMGPQRSEWIKHECLYSTSGSTVTSSYPPTSQFIPILPHPTTPSKRHHHHHQASEEGGGEEGCLRSEVTGLETVPVSILSPATTDKSFSDTESCHNYVDSPIKSRDSPSADKMGDSTSFGSSVGVEEGEGHKEGCDVMSGAGESKDCRLLWEFIYQLLNQDQGDDLVCWESPADLVFRINDPTRLADQWGSQKNRTNMTYEKLSRALRYYYKMNIIQKVPGKKLTYKFLQSPEKIRKGQRGARPHSFRSPQRSSFSACADGIRSSTDDDTIPMEACAVDKKSDENSFSAATSKNSFSIANMTKEERENDGSLFNHSPKQEIKSLESDKKEAANTRDISAMKFEDCKQRSFEDCGNVAKSDYDIDSVRRQRRGTSSSSLSPPVSRPISRDRSPSRPRSVPRYTKEGDENNPEPDVSMEESESSGDTRRSMTQDTLDEGCAQPAGNECFGNDKMLLNEPRDGDVTGKSHQRQFSPFLSPVLGFRGNDATSDDNKIISAIPQNNGGTCTALTTMPSFVENQNVPTNCIPDQDTSATCTTDPDKDVQPHRPYSRSSSSSSRDFQAKCSKSLFHASENPSSPSPSIELLKASSCGLTNPLTISPAFPPNTPSPSPIDQLTTTSLVSQAYACLDKPFLSRSPFGEGYRDSFHLEPHPHDFRHLAIPIDFGKHHHQNTHHYHPYNNSFNSTSFDYTAAPPPPPSSSSSSKPISLVTESTSDSTKYGIKNNNNNIPMDDAPLSYQTFSSPFEDMGRSRPKGIHIPNIYNAKYREPNTNTALSPSLNHGCTLSPNPLSYLLLSSPSPPSSLSSCSPSSTSRSTTSPLVMNMKRHGGTSAQDTVSENASIVKCPDVPSFFDSGRISSNDTTHCSDMPEDLSVKKVCS